MSNIKKIFAAIFAVMAVMLMSITAIAAVPDTVTGKGTESDPYMVSTYEDLQATFEGIDGLPSDCYVRLANDITQTTDSGTTYQGGTSVTKYNCIIKRYGSTTVHLDLAGKTLKLDAKCSADDKGMFYVTGGQLYINDSLGTGRIVNNSNIIPTFCITNNAYGINPVLTINAGTFSSDKGSHTVVSHSCPIKSSTAIDFTVYQARCYINGGKFNGSIVTDAVSSNDIFIKDCIINGRIYVNDVLHDNHHYLGHVNDTIFNKSTVTLNGTVVDKSTLDTAGGMCVYTSGNIVVTDPDKPKITKQPQDYNYYYLGTSHTFSVSATNAETYKWHIVDENDNELTWDYISAQGWGSLESSADTASSIQIGSVYSGLNGKKLYCEITGNGYTVISDMATINVDKNATYITITKQPPSLVYFDTGSTATVSIQATGRNMIYSWYFKLPTGLHFYLTKNLRLRTGQEVINSEEQQQTV